MDSSKAGEIEGAGEGGGDDGGDAAIVRNRNRNRHRHSLRVLFLLVKKLTWERQMGETNFPTSFK